MHTRERVRAAALPPGFDSAVLEEFEGNSIPLNNRAICAEHPVISPKRLKISFIKEDPSRHYGSTTSVFRRNGAGKIPPLCGGNVA